VKDSTYGQQWEAAIQEELTSLNANGTWQLTVLPEGRKAVTSKWVFKIKRHLDGSIDRFKARLVARGFTQQYGVNYTETFAPTVRLASLRFLMAVAARDDLIVHQMDVKSAYLAGSLDETIYMVPPEGLETHSKVCKLVKSLYGLKQSARVWNHKLRDHPTSHGYTQLQADYGLFFNGNVLIAAYVDDLAMAGPPDLVELNKAKAMLCSGFEMKDLGLCKHLLGMEVTQNPGITTIGQQGYIEAALKEFGLEQCKPVATPMEPGRKLQPAAENEPRCDQGIYQQLTGKLMWAMIVTRPDICFVVGRLSQFNMDPTEQHWIAAKRVLRYLSSTRKFTIHYVKNGNGLRGYSDSDYAEDHTRKSTSGCLFTLAGGAIAWTSKKQSLVAGSTTEAEYIAYSEAAKEAAWLRQLCLDTQQSDCLENDKSVWLGGDNQACLTIAKDPEHHGRTKAIDVRYHHVRDLIARGIITSEYVPTNSMLADGLTKALPQERSTKHMQVYGLW
jgi:hypothetical protein